MKKIFLNLFVLTGLLLSTSCSSSDDSDGGGDGDQAEELTVTIDGSAKTFDNVVLSDTEWGRQITATIGMQTNEIITMTANAGELGSNVIWEFYYTVGSKNYSVSSSSSSDIPDSYINTSVNTNNDSEFTASFSGVLLAYDNDLDDYVTIELSNGLIHTEF